MDVDATALDTMQEQIIRDQTAVQPDPDSRLRRAQEVRTLLEAVKDVFRHGAMYVALGVHAVGDGEFSISWLSLSDVQTHAPTGGLAAARCALALVETPLGTVLHRDLPELPCRAPAALVTYRLSNTPGRPGAAILTPPRDVLQARLAVARPSGSRTVIVDLTTTAMEFSDDYVEILLGVGRTLSFTDPSAATRVASRPSRILDALQ
ncbi:hypothetical protein [Streptomyces sp. NPDC047315]|uniref:hypothetical protein n=1 Tax=Streptomyces sp. NPDC047315 TaxID=3155142 RepID=UPI0033C615B7